MQWILLAALVGAGYLAFRQQDAIAQNGFRPGPGKPAGAERAALGAMVGAVLLAPGGGALVVPAHVTADKGPALEIVFDVDDPELAPVPPVLRGKRGLLPRASVDWVVFSG